MLVCSALKGLYENYTISIYNIVSILPYNFRIAVDIAFYHSCYPLGTSWTSGFRPSKDPLTKESFLHKYSCSFVLLTLATGCAVRNFASDGLWYTWSILVTLNDISNTLPTPEIYIQLTTRSTDFFVVGKMSIDLVGFVVLVGHCNDSLRVKYVVQVKGFCLFNKSNYEKPYSPSSLLLF